MILLNQVIQVLVGPDERLSGQSSFGFQFGNSAVRGFITVECDLLRRLMITDRFPEEANGSRFIAMLTQQEIDCPAPLIDRTVEIAPLKSVGTSERGSIITMIIHALQRLHQSRLLRLRE